MHRQGWIGAAGVACLLALFQGCQVPTLAGPMQAWGGGVDKQDEEARLFRSLMAQGRPAGGVAPGQPGPASPSGVQPVSATVPAGQVPGADGSVQGVGTSLAGAGAPAPAIEKDPDDESLFDWSALDPSNWYKNFKKMTGYGPDERIAEQYFQEGMALYREKKFAEAAAKFAQAADRWPDSILEEDALFFQAESYFFDDQYGKAHDTFRLLFKKHENSRYLDVAANRQFAIGRYWEQHDRVEPHWPFTPNLTDKTRPWFDTHGNALNAYLSVRLNDPTGPLADDAVMATANAYFAQGRFEEAAYHYDLLRKEYPKSEFQMRANLLALESRRQSYQGPLYDGKPLDEADEVARQSLRQFRSHLGPEQERVIKAVDEIRLQKAERQWALAQLYERKRAYGAARICYQGILADYPNTPIAHASQERIEAIKDFPDRPPNHFKWLTDAFDKLREN